MALVSRAKTAQQIGARVVQRFRERQADPRAVWGIPWPYPGLNTVTGGIHKTEMTILTARPSVGKTTVMVETANSVVEWLRSPDGHREAPEGIVKLVLCESTGEVFFRRWACLRSGVSLKKVQNGKASAQQAERFVREMGQMEHFPIEVLDTAQSLDEVVAFLKTGNTVWWALDYVQKCPVSPSRPNDGSVGVITLLSGALTEVAKLKAPGLVLAHTPHEVDKREEGWCALSSAGAR